MVRTLARACLAACVFWGTHSAAEGREVALVGGRVLSLLDSDLDIRDRISISFADDPGIAEPLPSPLCPAVTVLTIRDNDEEVSVTLPCENWFPGFGGGYKYTDRSGAILGIRRIRLKEKKLSIKARGVAYSVNAITPPVSEVEVELKVHSTVYCGRFESPPSTFVRNDATRLRARGPSVACKDPPPPFPPPPCFTGTDPVTEDPWVVCAADTNTTWVSANSSGFYRPDLICLYLGYNVVSQIGATCGNVCGRCELPTSCSTPGMRVFDGNGGGSYPPTAGQTVHWECAM